MSKIDLYNSNSVSSQLSLFDHDIFYFKTISTDNGSVCLQILNNEYEITDFFTKFFKINDSLISRIKQHSIILIKPNITSDELPSSGRTSNPMILDSLIKFLLKEGIKKSQIVVGDSAVIGVDTKSAAIKAGIYEVCTTNEIPFIDLNEGPFNTIQISESLMHKSISIHELAKDEDVFIINLAKIKTTYGSPVGLCVKNLKGLISTEEKLNFHLKGVQESLIDLHSAITCGLNILEGFPGSELGIPKKCNLVGISQSDFLLDSIISEIIGVSYKDVPHLKILMENNVKDDLGVTTLDVIKTFQFAIDKFHHSVHGVNDLAELFGITIIDGSPCTACLESFYKALNRLKKEQMLPYDCIFILGLWHIKNKIANELNNKVYIGECALSKYNPNNTSGKQTGKNKQSNSDYAIPGCPPTIDSMVKKLKEASIELFDDKENDDSSLLSYHELSTEPQCKPSPVILKWIDIPPIDNIILSKNLKSIIPILPKEDIEFNSLGIANAIQCEFITAAICHQMNWDFIRDRIKKIASENSDFIKFGYLKETSKNDMEALFRGYHKPDRIKPEERAKMLRDLANYLISFGDTLVEILNQHPRNIEGKNGLLNFLRKTPVFSDDPEMKKAQVFIHSILRGKLWDFIDDDKVQPAIDYHIMRLYIRRGNIWPRTKNGELYLKQNIRRYSKTTVALRSIVADAIRAIARYHNIKIVDVNSAEWWIGRSVCKRSNPDCDLKNSDSKWLKNYFKECPYKEDCAVWTTDNSLLDVTEPRETSKFY